MIEVSQHSSTHVISGLALSKDMLPPETTPRKRQKMSSMNRDKTSSTKSQTDIIYIGMRRLGITKMAKRVWWAAMDCIKRGQTMGNSSLSCAEATLYGHHNNFVSSQGYLQEDIGITRRPH